MLDPAQNHTFRDHYLELDLDLSDVLFIATANVLETIPPALLDRMELVTLDGYTEDDKVAIARDFLVPRQLERAALTADEVTVTDDALREIAANYTREAGVRQLERMHREGVPQGGDKLASGTPAPITVDVPALKDLIGRPRFTPDAARAHRGAGRGDRARRHRPGRRRALHRGVVAARRGHRPGCSLTGQLGDVMKESAQIALSYVRAHAAELGVDPAALDRPVHLHVPGGRGAQGRAVGRRHDDHRAGVAADRPHRSAARSA